MSLPVEPPIEPMLAQLRSEIPEGGEWLYEPKWDGFRALVYRDGERIRLASRRGQPLERYFPELVQLLHDALPARCVVDGEIILAGPSGLDFEALQLRLHPAESRVRKLAAETPTCFVAFDLLALDDEDLRDRPLAERRASLEKAVRFGESVFLTPQTTDAEEARSWFVRFEGAGLDGVVAKRADQRYAPGERVMVKVKHRRTADCVLVGYRVAKSGDAIGSLLLGLYNENGVLQFVGHTSSFSARERRELLEILRPFERGPGEGHGPGGASRWSQGKDLGWVSLEPGLVCEVAFDHLQGHRFRHATRFLRWREDKDPSDCTYEQFEPPHAFKLEDVIALGR